jgi:hypothetical protein
MPVFQYRSLDPSQQEIRLVQTTPLSGHTAPIRLNLVYTSLLNRPHYYALSYTWGAPHAGLPPEWDDENATRLIYVNDHEFHVRWNLEAVLRILCERRKEPPHHLTWIDAICINQQDLKERSYQVRLMISIYESSGGTMVWLGPATRDSDLAFRAISDFHSSWQKRSAEFKKTYRVKEEQKAYYSLFVDEELKLEDSEDRLLAVANLFLRSWWRRAWIVQEVVASPGTVFYCGKSPIIAKTWLVSVYRMLMQHEFSFGRVFPEMGRRLPAIIKALAKASMGFIRVIDVIVAQK